MTRTRNPEKQATRSSWFNSTNENDETSSLNLNFRTFRNVCQIYIFLVPYLVTNWLPISNYIIFLSDILKKMHSCKNEISLKQTFIWHLHYFSWNLQHSIDKMSLSCSNIKQILSKFQFWTCIWKSSGILARIGNKLSTNSKPIPFFCTVVKEMQFLHLMKYLKDKYSMGICFIFPEFCIVQLIRSHFLVQI